MFKHYLGDLDFDDIEKLEKTFDKDQKLKTYIDYQYYLKKYRFFAKLETKVSRSSKIEFDRFISDLKTFYDKYHKAWFFRKRRLKSDFLMKNHLRLSFLSLKKNVDKKLLKALVKEQGF